MRQAYQQLIDNQQLSRDPAQRHAVEVLASLSEQLVAQSQAKPLRFSPWRKKAKVNGIYFHGRVGRGKTMLMDLFYQHLQIKNKQRIHFHRFMESVHQQLDQLPTCDNPLARIAKTWAAQLDLLCFDEFFVSDIGDAMLLAGLLTALFDLGVTLVATSNSEPENLYRNGLQRERFLPTIALLTQHCQIVSVNGKKDHRLVDYQPSLHYRDYLFSGNDKLQNQAVETQLSKRFTQLSAFDEPGIGPGEITINGREIVFKGKLATCIWFDFFALCSGPRSQRDYISIADQFSTVFIDQVPQFGGKPVKAIVSGVEDCYQRSGVLLPSLRELDDEARRFIALVDEFYDRNIQLIIGAVVDIRDLYQGQQLSFEFDRCQSRLIEMQSKCYTTRLVGAAPLG